MISKADKQQAAQEAYLELQIITNQVKQLHGQVQLIDEQIIEINSVIHSLDDFKECSVGSDIMVPLSSGIFVKGSLKDNKELIVNVGADVAVKKDIPSTKELLAGRIGEIQKQREELLAELQKTALQAQQVEQRLAKLLK
jgi:prefoldin alpha subunit